MRGGCYCTLSPHQSRLSFKTHAKKCSRYSTWGIPSVHNPSLIALPTHQTHLSLTIACESNLQSVPDHCHHMQIPILKSVSFSIESAPSHFPHTSIYVIVMSTFPFSSPSPQVPFRYVCECCFSAICGNMEKFFLFLFLADKAKRNIK
jgi:hypothetical protein